VTVVEVGNLKSIWTLNALAGSVSQGETLLVFSEYEVNFLEEVGGEHTYKLRTGHALSLFQQEIDCSLLIHCLFTVAWLSTFIHDRKSLELLFLSIYFVSIYSLNLFSKGEGQ
jgi:hypothetical protein